MARKNAGIALALGGGGARGFAHVGVLELLHQRGVRVESIIGTSSGALAGAGYALGFSPQQMRQRVLEFAHSALATNPKVRALVKQTEDTVCRSLGDRVGRIFCQGQMVKSLFMASSVLSEDFFRELVRFFLPEVRIEDMSIPFAAVATDVLTGEIVVFDRGPLRQAVLASVSVPGVAPPVKLNGHLLVDGGVAALVPTAEARARGARRLLAVSVDHQIASDAPPDQALEIYLRAGDIQGARLNQLQMDLADLALRPEVGGFHWADFSKAQLIMDLGHESALLAWEAIAELGRDGWRKRLGQAWRVGVQAVQHAPAVR